MIETKVRSYQRSVRKDYNTKISASGGSHSASSKVSMINLKTV